VLTDLYTTLNDWLSISIYHAIKHTSWKVLPVLLTGITCCLYCKELFAQKVTPNFVVLKSRFFSCFKANHICNIFHRVCVSIFPKSAISPDDYMFWWLNLLFFTTASLTVLIFAGRPCHCVPSSPKGNISDFLFQNLCAKWLGLAIAYLAQGSHWHGFFLAHHIPFNSWKSLWNISRYVMLAWIKTVSERVG